MTYAIVNIQGKQFKLFENKYVYVPHITSVNLGDTILLTQVFMFFNKGILFLGNPFLENISVQVEILQHIKGKKIVIFKKKRRKGYQVRNGFRPIYSKIKVISFKEKNSN
ncbi:50S ribosomal protein L21 [Blattabacterium sp. (Blattella germanica) str. Bge]|uniref:50S ribosomal protein L21 n=1 Tax=Blattabacterium sp. (Blattella germanica) TaxID=624186 RepID=UPI0001BB62BF|nr:50S ribosomal protein L21 [Blattabacterium sp. (Blattella germanica)]ACY40063.1 50S ribosomal protein L21 [Blattabacterium sp. (Blattella germanica) str. Bge]